jgi:hypothetical protein
VNTTWIKRLKTAIAIIALLGLASCGGGGGSGGGSVSGSSASVSNAQTSSVTLPDLAVNVQTAVLKPGVTAQDPVLTRTGDNSFHASSGIWTQDQVFMFGSRLYKVIGLTANADGSTEIVTRAAALNEAFSDLQLSVRSHAIAYDDAGKALTAAQFANTQQVGLWASAENWFTGSDANLCLIPKNESSSDSSGKTEFGYSYTVDCSLAQLLALKDSKLDLIKFSGELSLTTVSDLVIDVAKDTEYEEKTSKLGFSQLKATLAMTSDYAEGGLTRLEKACKDFKDNGNLIGNKNGINRCEVKADQATGGLNLKIGRSLIFKQIWVQAGAARIPLYLDIGLDIDLTIDAQGGVVVKDVSFSRKITNGKKEGRAINEDTGVTQDKEMSISLEGLNGTSDVSFGAYTSVGAGLASELSLVDATASLGAYFSATGKLLTTGAVACFDREWGARGGLNITFLRNPVFDGIEWPVYNHNWIWGGDGNCADSKIKLDYVLNGKDFYSYDAEASSQGTNLDVYNAEPAFILNRSQPLTVDLSTTRGIPNKALDFEVEVLDASKNVTAQYVPTTSNGITRNLVKIDPGNTQPLDKIKVKFKAFVPGDRANTEVSRVMWINITQTFTAAPVMRMESEYDSRSSVFNQRMNSKWWINENLAGTTSEIAAGYYEFDDGYRYYFTDIDGQGYFSVESNRTPTKLGLYSQSAFRDLGWDAPARVFDITLNTSATQYTGIAVTPAQAKKGEVLGIKVNGMAMPAEIPLAVSGCSSPVEVLPDANGKYNDSPYERSSELRYYTCTANLAGAAFQAAVAGSSVVSNTFAVTDTNSISASTLIAKVGDTVRFWIDTASGYWAYATHVIWNFASNMANQAAILWDGTKAEVSQQFNTLGAYTVTATYMNSNGNTLGSETLTMNVQAADAPTPPVITSAVKQSNGTVSVVGTADKGVTVTVTWPDNTTGMVNADAAGAWSITSVNAGYAAGQTVSVVAVSGSGSSAAATAAITVTGTGTGRLNDTGISASQCYQAGSDVLVACDSAGAIALNNAQDGMTGRDVTSNGNTDGKLGFSFAAVAGGCVQDNVTGLMWEVKTTDGGLRDMNKTYTNYDSTSAAQKWTGSTSVAPTQAEVDAATNSVGFITAVNASNLCGYSDWRLPTADELQSIVDYGGGYRAIDTTWFPNTPGGMFWSASPSVGDPLHAWSVFGGGGMGDSSGYGRGSSGYVRLVRGVQSPTLPRYTVSADGQEVTDNQTMLIWRRCSEGMSWNGTTCAGTASGFTHEAALQRAAVQANSTGIAWRLPNVKELFSIADISLNNPAIDPTAFPATPGYDFWSSSPYVGDSYDAPWNVDFGNGAMFNQYFRSNTFYVRLVRAGQTGLPAGYVSQGGLIWMPNNIGTFSIMGYPAQTDFPGASSYCSSITSLGQTGWRLPTRNELLALYASGAINGQGWTLSNTWSSTGTGTGNVYHDINLGNGADNWVAGYWESYVTCVHAP